MGRHVTKAIRNTSLLAAICCVCVGTFAQEHRSDGSPEGVLGTISTAPSQESADGVVQACGLAFSALVDDRVSRRGAPVKMGGTFHLRRARHGELLFTLKLGLVDDPGGVDTTSAPSNAFIRSPGGKTPRQAARRESSPGFALYISPVDADVRAAYDAIVDRAQVVVGFNRRRGQPYVTALVDLTVVNAYIAGDRVVRERSDVPVEEFTSCARELLLHRTPAGAAAPTVSFRPGDIGLSVR